jgi:hypothetical protein
MTAQVGKLLFCITGQIGHGTFGVRYSDWGLSFA